MRAKPLYKDRYPGLVPFDKGQSTIFFGREQEKKELFYQVSLEKMVVLFGKSGLGKSSLLNAGVSPMLEKTGYLPVRVRFTSGTQASAEEGSENLLLRDFILAFKGYRYKRKILFNKESPQLWEYIKATNYNELVEEEANAQLTSWLNNKESENSGNSTAPAVPVIPVFIFDQFEEFFHHPVKHQQEFLSQLAEIVHDETPYRILDWITNMEPEERTPAQVSWHQQPNIKVVFALRSDKLANMQSMVSYIPTVLRTRYELKPLTSLQAAQAIKGPAEKPDLGPEYILPFTFDETTLQEIVHELSGETNEIESSQLQIVCNFIEQRVRREFRTTEGSGPLVVNKNIIDPPKDFPLILDNFYETQLAKIEDPKNRDLARKLIEDDLVIEGQRDSISKKKLNKYHGIGDGLIEEILNTRLIREENTSRGPIYELSHDTLIAPVVKSRDKREEQEAAKKREEEKLILAELAKKKDEELKEKYRQLATEIQLREEAERQKAEVIRLSSRLKTRGRWVFFLTTAVLIATIVYIKLMQRNSYLKKKKDLSKTQIELLYNKLDNAKQSTVDTGAKENTKSNFLTLIVDADSISKITDNNNNIINKDTVIDNMIDSIYKDDFRKRKINPDKLTTTEKIETLKKIIPGYNQLRRNPNDKSKQVFLE